MMELNEILKTVGKEHQSRIAEALRLMAIQARGSERLRAEATTWIK